MKRPAVNRTAPAATGHCERAAGVAILRPTRVPEAMPAGCRGAAARRQGGRGVSPADSRFHRIAIVSTPRSGNSWVRTVLRDALAMPDIAVNNPRDIPADLPDRVVLQLHWYREPNFQDYLRAHGFRVVVLSRHPLDVLISAWHFVGYEPATSRWLEGNAELPADIGEQPPAAPAFLSYATSWGAENLLSVSYQWWYDSAAVRRRYEDLVGDPVTGFTDLIRSLGGCPRNLGPALQSNRLAVFQQLPNRHGWRGQPGLWRKLLPPAAALEVWWKHRRVFQTLGRRFPTRFSAAPSSAPGHGRRGP